MGGGTAAPLRVASWRGTVWSNASQAGAPVPEGRGSMVRGAWLPFQRVGIIKQRLPGIKYPVLTRDSKACFDGPYRITIQEYHE